MSPRILKLALALAGLLIAIFIVSFVIGLRDGLNGSGRVGEIDERTGAPRVRVEVLNGAGRAGLAREATERLRDRGLDVVYFGNAREFGRDSTVVLDRVGREENARAVAEALGITAIRSEPDSTLLLDVTVILGRDWPATQP